MTSPSVRSANPRRPTADRHLQLPLQRSSTRSSGTQNRTAVQFSARPVRGLDPHHPRGEKSETADRSRPPHARGRASFARSTSTSQSSHFGRSSQRVCSRIRRFSDSRQNVGKYVGVVWPSAPRARMYASVGDFPSPGFAFATSTRRTGRRSSPPPRSPRSGRGPSRRRSRRCGCRCASRRRSCPLRLVGGGDEHDQRLVPRAGARLDRLDQRPAQAQRVDLVDDATRHVQAVRGLSDP
jgi:hypothetical protein